MNKEPLLLFTGLGIAGYIVFHGHRLNRDCWLCAYKGLTFLGSSLALGTFLAVNEN